MEDRYWVYHPVHDAKIVTHAEFQKLLNAGWYDTPAKFPDAILPVTVSADDDDDKVSVSVDPPVKRRSRKK